MLPYKGLQLLVACRIWKKGRWITYSSMDIDNPNSPERTALEQELDDLSSVLSYKPFDKLPRAGFLEPCGNFELHVLK